MVLKQRQVLSPRPQPNLRSSSVPGSGSGVSLPMGDGRVSPRTAMFQSAQSSFAKRRSVGSLLGAVGARKMKLETTPTSTGNIRSSSLSSLSPRERPLSPSFFRDSPASTGSASGKRESRGAAFFCGGSSSSAPTSTDYLRNVHGGRRNRRVLAVVLSLAAVAATAFFVASTSLQLAEREEQLSQLRKDFHVLRHKVRETEDALRSAHGTNHDLEVRSSKLEKDNSKLKKELNAAKVAKKWSEERSQSEQSKKRAELTNADVEELLQGKEMSGLAQEEVNALLARRQNAMKSRIKSLQEQIQTISRREAEERFGPGPYRVQFSVMLSKNRPDNFTIELAPLSLMPHSVHLFLQMVFHGLWDDTIFLHTAHHVLQAAPLRYPSGTSKRANFDELGLAHLSFQEYSPDFPHEKYTIGFGGRPGGPDFFINTQDNSEYHGPGGQDHHDLHEEADPCFGKIVKGREVVDRLHRRSIAMVGTGNEGWEGSDIPITTIVSVRLLESEVIA